MARRRAPKEPKSCDRMADAVHFFGSTMAQIADGGAPRGFSILGPKDKYIFYKIKCVSKKKFGPGDCGSWEIERSGDVPKGLKKKDYVGNLHGMAHQVSRDFARLWQPKCVLSPTSGFQGAKPRRSRKKRK